MTKEFLESKYYWLFKKREKIELKDFKDLRVFIEYSSDVNNVYKDIDD